MNKLSRRQFLLDATAVPLALWLPGSAALAQAAPLVRHDIASPEGAAMLEVYANAIRAMRTRSQTDPLGWQWQWYTHFVNGTTNKAAELTRLFGTTPSARRALADEVWNTCQPHSGQNANFFFPWHRMYTYYMERIVRRVSGVANFTMPYWDYTSSDPARRGVVPGQFRLPNHPVYGVLYRAERNPLANAGLPIHRDQPGDAMNMDDAMARVRYETIGAVQGFCRAVDAGIHGRIHVLVGNARGMGNVPYAANDPLFLVHHSNVDRMWVSWIRNGHSNPTDATLSPWITGAFALVDSNGARVSRQCRELFSASQMGYVYSRYLPPPPAPASLAAATAAARAGAGAGVASRIAAASAPARLGTTATTVRLLRRSGARPTEVLGLDPGSGRALLVLAKLHAWQQPGVLYHVYVSNQPDGPRDAGHYAGAINFFDAQFHAHGGGSRLDEALGENFQSFDVTSVLQAIAARPHGSEASERLYVSFVPGGTPLAGADPMVAKIELVLQS